MEEPEEEFYEQGVTISEFIEDREAEELEADLLLGGDEGEECTYVKGYLKRQAVFSCLTCTPAGNAGFCTACSLLCHDGHQVVKLWTRRNFRCDCGNDKFGAFECQLYKDKDSQNMGNVYNQNYGGVHCTCHSPFLEPPTAAGEPLLQCCICEDFFHETHLGLSSLLHLPRDHEYGVPFFFELICPSCVTTRCSFLSEYPELLVPPFQLQNDDEDPTASSAPFKVSSAALALEPSQLRAKSRDSFAQTGSDSDDSSRSIIDESPAEEQVGAFGEGSADIAIGESSEGGVVLCKLKQSQLKSGSTSEGGVEGIMGGQAVVFDIPWRAELCQCEACVAMYAAKGVGFLLDREDSTLEYEKAVTRKREERQVKEEATLSDVINKLGHVEKMELIRGVNDMETELRSFLAPFGAGKTVTIADVYEFSEKLRQKQKRSRIRALDRINRFA